VLAATRQAAERSGSPQAIASALLAEGVTDVYAGRWAPGLERLRSAETLLRERCTGTHWEINSCRLFELIALFFLGRVRELAQIRGEHVREAEQRGNVLGQAIGLLGSAAWLLDGDIAEAKRQADVTMERWSRVSPVGLQMPHAWDLNARANIATYAGVPAWHELRTRYPDIGRSLLFRVESTRINYHQGLGRLALSEAVLQADGEKRAILLQEAQRAVRTLRRELAPFAQAFAVLIDAQIRHLAGRPEEAVALLADAVRRLDAADLHMHAAVARIRQGQLVGGDEGARLRAAGAEWMTRERIAEPDRWLRMLSPGFSAG
jgi:hypothetical protein